MSEGLGAAGGSAVGAAGARPETTDAPRRRAPTSVVPLRVLVFDVEPTVCVAAHGALAEAGFVVDVTSSPTTLYRAIHSDAPPYDALVVACGNGGAPAEPFTRYMRSAHPAIAVALAVAADDVELGRLPCDAWIEAPYRPSAVVDVVRAAASAARKRRLRGDDAK